MLHPQLADSKMHRNSHPLPASAAATRQALQLLRKGQRRLLVARRRDTIQRHPKTYKPTPAQAKLAQGCLPADPGPSVTQAVFQQLRPGPNRSSATQAHAASAIFVVYGRWPAELSSVLVVLHSLVFPDGENNYNFHGGTAAIL